MVYDCFTDIIRVLISSSLQPPQFDIAMVWMANEVVGLPIEIVIFHSHVSLPQGIYVLGYICQLRDLASIDRFL